MNEHFVKKIPRILVMKKKVQRIDTDFIFFKMNTHKILAQNMARINQRILMCPVVQWGMDSPQNPHKCVIMTLWVCDPSVKA